MPLDTATTKIENPPSRPAAKRARPAKAVPANAGRTTRKAVHVTDGAASAPSAASIDTRPHGASGRHTLIAEAAYFRAERRGFIAGREEQDWLEAEAEVDARLSASREPSPASQGRKSRAASSGAAR